MRATYIKSLEALADRPQPLLPEILLMGRSNVGKSSFINALTQRKQLARSSKTPGKTLLFNYFNINDQYYLVDSPGYGYARRSKAKKNRFITMFEDFLGNHRSLKAVILLIDFKVGPTNLDLETLEFIRSMGHVVAVVATKMDKVAKTKRYAHKKRWLKMLGFDNLLLVDSQNRVGFEQVYQLIRLLLEEKNV